MKNAPWFKFYPADFMGGVVELSSEERGSYITLLCAQWSTGSLPPEHARLERIAGGPVSDAVRGKFLAGGDGRLRNVRLETHREEATAKSRQATAAIEKRWKDERSTEKDTDVIRTNNGGSTGVHTESESESESESDIRVKRPESEKDSCAESGVPAPAPDASPVVLTFQCAGKKGETWELHQSQVDSWGDVYPGLDVLAECKRAQAWEDATPRKRKTKKGKKAFLNSWLARSQDRAPAFGLPTTAKMSDAEIQAFYGNGSKA